MNLNVQTVWKDVNSAILFNFVALAKRDIIFMKEYVCRTAPPEPLQLLRIISVIRVAKTVWCARITQPVIPVPLDIITFPFLIVMLECACLTVMGVITRIPKQKNVYNAKKGVWSVLQRKIANSVVEH